MGGRRCNNRQTNQTADGSHAAHRPDRVVRVGRDEGRAGERAWEGPGRRNADFGLWRGVPAGDFRRLGFGLANCHQRDEVIQGGEVLCSNACLQLLLRVIELECYLCVLGM